MDLADAAACGRSRAACSATTRRASRSTACSRASTGRRTASAIVATRRRQALEVRRGERARARPSPSRRRSSRASPSRCATRGRRTRDTCARASCAGRWRAPTASAWSSPRSATSTRWTCPSGTPRRLTERHRPRVRARLLARRPQLAFVTWNDAEGGHVWVTTPGGGDAAPGDHRSPAQYANPSFSPDGAQRRLPQGQRRHVPRRRPRRRAVARDALGARPRAASGRYMIGHQEPRAEPAHDAAEVLGATGSAIFFVRRRGREADRGGQDDARRRCGSTAPTGARTCASPGRRRRSVSPDGRWVAFSELHNAYVTAMPELAAEAVDIGPDKGAAARGQADGRGRRVGGLGRRRPDGHLDLRARRTTGSHSTRRCRRRSPRRPTRRSRRARTTRRTTGRTRRRTTRRSCPSRRQIEITLTLPRARPAGVVAYQGARIVTMKGDEVIEHGTIVVEGDRIKAVGSNVAVPPGARREARPRSRRPP